MLMRQTEEGDEGRTGRAQGLAIVFVASLKVKERFEFGELLACGAGKRLAIKQKRVSKKIKKRGKGRERKEKKRERENQHPTSF